MGTTCCSVCSLGGVWCVRMNVFSSATLLNRSAGCQQLAEVERNIVTAFTEVGGDDNNRFTVTLNRAYQVCVMAIETSRMAIKPQQCARQGQYWTGVEMLIDPMVWRGISLVDYNVWAAQIWSILALRATR
jgi:anaphase-promoting complex subunit 5